MDTQVAPTYRRDGGRPFREILEAAERSLAEEDGNERPEAMEAKADAGVEAILTERGKTHGSFADNARVSQAVKRVLRAELGWELLTDIEREVMDQIALKFSRIVSGKSREKQHWEDVVGYGTLAEKDCI